MLHQVIKVTLCLPCHQAEQLKQQQLKRLAAQQQQAAQGQTIVAGQKVVAGTAVTAVAAGGAQKTVSVSTPLLTTMATTAGTQAARIQVRSRF